MTRRMAAILTLFFVFLRWPPLLVAATRKSALPRRRSSPKQAPITIFLPGPIVIDGVTYDSATLVLAPHAAPAPPPPPTPGSLVDLLDKERNQTWTVTTGEALRLRGTGFGPVSGAVTIAGAAATIVSWDGTIDPDGWEKIDLVMGPVASRQTGPVIVSRLWGALTSTWQVTAAPAPPPPGGPTINGFLDAGGKRLSAASYPNGNASEIVIVGHGFGDSIGRGLFTGLPCTVLFWSDTKVILTPPTWCWPGPGFPFQTVPLSGDIAIIRPDGLSVVSGPVGPWPLSRSTATPKR